MAIELTVHEEGVSAMMQIMSSGDSLLNSPEHCAIPALLFYDAVVTSTRDESVMLMAQGRAELALGDIQYHFKT